MKLFCDHWFYVVFIRELSGRWLSKKKPNGHRQASMLLNIYKNYSFIRKEK